METKRKIEILEDLIKRVKADANYSRGFCYHLKDSVKGEELKEMDEFLWSNKPCSSKYPAMYVSHRFIKFGFAWWTMDEEGFALRIIFLNTLIEELNEEPLKTSP